MSVKRSLAWMGLAQGSSFILQFTASVVVARYLTPYESGIYAAAVAVVGVLSLIQALGLQALIVREERLTPDISATAFTVNALISLFLCACILIASVGGGAFLGDLGVQKVLGVLALNPVLGIFSFLPAANLERSGRFKEMALISLACTIVAALLTILLAVLGFSYMSVAYAQVASGVVNTMLMNIVGRQHIGFRIGLKAWRRISEFGLQMLAVSGINSVSGRLSDVLVGRMLGLSALGIYNRASALNNLIFVNIHIVVGRVIFVDFSSLHRQEIALRERYLRTLEIITATLWPAFAGLAIVAKPFIFIVYGPNWVSAALPLAFLAFASIIQVAISMTWELFAATGQLRVQTRIEFIRSGFALLTFGTGCLISLEAAAAARVLDALCAFCLYRRHINRMTKTTTRDFWPIYVRSALLTVLAVGPAGILMAISGMSAYVPVVFLGIAIVAGIALWILGLFLLKHPLASEFRSISARF
jgi:O-antigen/teichoic acid export membrane protein